MILTMNFKRVLTVIVCVLFIKGYSQTFYNQNTLQKIELNFPNSNWDFQLDTAKAGADTYIMATWVKINGTQFDTVGVKYKGNSSYNSSYIKNPLHIELDYNKNQSYQGYKDIKLGNGYADPSAIREVLSYDMLKNYMDCPLANFAQVYINGAYIGVYSNAESINKKFVSDHFYSSAGTFIKCNPIINPGPATKSNLKYINSDSSSYFNFYEIKSNYGWSDLVRLCDTVTNFQNKFSSNLDADRIIWMMAFNSVLVNLDSYSGVFCQNYYLYKDNTSHYNPVIWDLNMCMGGFPYVGSGNSSMGSLTVANMQQLSPYMHSTDPYWPLLNIIFNNAQYKRMYIAHMRTITNEMFASNLYQTKAAALQTVIDTALQSDVNKFFTYTQFQNAMNTNYVVGSYTVPGISTLMGARVSFLQSSTDFTLTPPAITNVTTNVTSPNINSTVVVTASVTGSNSGSVYLGYRFGNAQKFTRYLMYDDGLHGDGAASDNKFGGSFVMSSAQAQYYIYAENNNAGMFSPERAEHEFYTLTASAQTATVGQLVINEFLADNQSDVKNENNVYADWIEFYNRTNSPLSLFGLFLTDNFANKTKFAFPAGTVINPNGYLIVWADQGTSSSSYVHANFKLSSTGDQIMLSDGSGAVLDSITFGAQAPDVAIGRCPNGTGSFTIMAYPTFNYGNCGVGIEEFGVASSEFGVFPNPAYHYLNIILGSGFKGDLEVYNLMGEIIHKEFVSEKTTINTGEWKPGMYILKAGNGTKKILILSQ